MHRKGQSSLSGTWDKASVRGGRVRRKGPYGFGTSASLQGLPTVVEYCPPPLPQSQLEGFLLRREEEAGQAGQGTHRLGVTWESWFPMKPGTPQGSETTWGPTVTHFLAAATPERFSLGGAASVQELCR